jgi:thiamine biosynthesis lipoprotein
MSSDFRTSTLNAIQWCVALLTTMIARENRRFVPHERQRCAILALLLFVGVGTASADEPADIGRYEATQMHMGTLFRIVVYADLKTAQTAIPEAFSRIGEIDLRLSDYKPKSELSQLTSKTGQDVRVSDDLWDVLLMSQQVHEQSAGAFDIALGPITKLWRSARMQKKLPAAEALETALMRSGMNFIKLNPKNQSIHLTRSEMALDPGGIAKGWAVQQAVDVLRKHGIQSALIDGGGDMYMAGKPQGKEGWKIEVAPLRPGNKATTVVSLQDRAIATSGDTWQYLETDGKRYSHIVDPKTGMGVTTPSSVTVIAEDGGLADAWASAISVLGPQRGLEIINKHPKIEALIIYMDERGDIHKASSTGFADYVVP